MKVIIYKDDNNGLNIIYPAYQENMSQQEQDDFLLFVRNKDVPKLYDGTARESWLIEEKDTLQTKYIFQAWEIDNAGKLCFNKDKGIKIKKDHLRFLRKPFLEKLDIDFMRAFESGDTKLISEIATKKQILRDITKLDMSNINDPKELYDFVPDELKS